VPPERFHAPIVAALAAVVLLVNIGGVALHDEDEPRNAACSRAMAARGDWVVPSFNGQMRLDKPALVNWLHLAGYAVAGPNETGARLGGAILSVGTCLLTWAIGRRLHGAAVGFLAGCAMASAAWTGIAGRAATPDAPLTFFTTLALALFVGGIGVAGRPTISRRRAMAIGAACGGALLTKGPIGLLFPLAALVGCGLLLGAGTSGRPGVRDRLAGVVAVRPGWIVAAALVVAAPWYVWVSLRTDGAWLKGFLLIHNLRRFTQPMEGHSGSWLYYPAVVAVTFFPWSIVLAATLSRACVLSWRPADQRHAATVISTVWVATWVLALSAAATKLPGYVWPAFPALAVLTAAFLHDWFQDDLPGFGRRAEGALLPDRTMAVAWTILLVAGLCIAAAPWLAGDRLPDTARWLAVPALACTAGAVAAWWWQRRGRRDRSLATLALTAAAFTGFIAAAGPTAVQSGAAGPRHLATLLAPPATDDAWVSVGTVPASVVFYTGATIREVESIAAAADHLRRHPDGMVFAARDNARDLAPLLGPDHVVVHRVPLPFADELVVVARRASAETIAACEPPSQP